MSLQSFLNHVNERGYNKFFIFFKDKDGNTDNICFQDNIFFSVNKNKKIRFLNPLRAIDELNEYEEKEKRIIGIGHYIQDVDFTKNYDWKGEKRSSWVLF